MTHFTISNSFLCIKIGIRLFIDINVPIGNVAANFNSLCHTHTFCLAVTVQHTPLSQHLNDVTSIDSACRANDGWQQVLMALGKTRNVHSTNKPSQLRHVDFCFICKVPHTAV